MVAHEGDYAALAAGSDELGTLDPVQFDRLFNPGAAQNGAPENAIIAEEPGPDQARNILGADIPAMQQPIVELEPHGSASPEQQSLDGAAQNGAPENAIIAEEPGPDQARNILGADIPAMQQPIVELEPQGSASPEQQSLDLTNAITGADESETARNNTDRPIPPESDNPEQDPQENVRSPQFRQAGRGFGQTLQTGQTGNALEVSQEATATGWSKGAIEFSKKWSDGKEKAAKEEEKAEDDKEPETKRGKLDDQKDRD